MATPLTSMLKTSGSTESITRPGKGRVGVGGDGGDDGGHDEKHSPQGSGRAYQRTHQLEQPRLRSGMIVLMVVVASRSKSRRKVVKKPEEPQRPEKSAKTIGSEEPSFLASDTRLAFTMMSSSRTHDGELLALLKPLRSGTLFLLGPGALSISASIISKTRLIEPLILCHVFPQRSQT